MVRWVDLPGPDGAAAHDLEFMRRWELVLYETSPGRVIQALERRSKNRRDSESSVFLFHSHRDQRLARAAINFIASQGVVVYVDWIDGGVPERFPEDMVQRSREAVRQNQKFIFLATAEGLTSPWAPWELGVADGAMGLEHVAILPIEDPDSEYPANDLLSVYPTIRRFNQSWVVVHSQRAVAERLEDWLTA